MAEGDTVFRWARKLEQAFDGRKILSAEAPSARSPLRRTVARLNGLHLDRAESRGKHLILQFHGGLALHAHMGMSGGWYVYEPGQRWKRQRQTAWLVMCLTGDDLPPLEVVQFGGPTLRLVRKVELGRDSRLACLGADLLDPDFDVERGAEALVAAGPMELGEALLDQHRLAGIGNIFKSESCFEARLNPWRPVSSFSFAELTMVVEIAREQLQTGVDTGQRPHRIYRMAGKPCPRCGHLVKSRGQGLDSRITYWCGSCQT
ncbi:MAG: DNA-formamidopyrimidine glycosylase family protein [Solirubrobacterales bacterium]